MWRWGLRSAVYPRVAFDERTNVIVSPESRGTLGARVFLRSIRPLPCLRASTRSGSAAFWFNGSMVPSCIFVLLCLTQLTNCRVARKKALLVTSLAPFDAESKRFIHRLNEPNRFLIALLLHFSPLSHYLRW